MDLKKIISEIRLKSLSTATINESKALLDIRNESEIRKNSFNKHKISEDEHEKWFNRIIKDKYVKNYLVFRSKEIIGNLSIYNLTNNLSSGYWSFYIGKRYRKVGVGFGLEYKSLSYIFEKLEIKLINCYVLNSNTEVIKLHKKFGFKITNNKNNVELPKKFKNITTHLVLDYKIWKKNKKKINTRFLL